jgi:3-dehydroquinate dehydratase-1
MLKIANLALNGTPRVAIGFKDNVTSETIKEIADFGLDIVELRIDQYSSFETAYVVREIKKFRAFPSIATIRSEKEGGGWNLSEKKRLDLFKSILPYVDAIDIELSSKEILKNVVSNANKLKKLVCISYHDFVKTPVTKKLEQVLKEAKSCGADIVKIATLAKNRDDVQILADFTIQNNSKNIITISMGSEGTISRVFFPALGSLITYASLGGATAPGQLDYSLTTDLLRLMYPKYNQEKINSLKLLELA